MSTHTEDELVQLTKRFIPSLKESKHKGQDGRIGVVGGSLEYTGAPYFAGTSAFKTGADLVHVFCCKDASIPIKSFSPDFIVHPILDDDNALKQIEPWLERLHVILIGPGLGRDEKVFDTVSKLIGVCRSLSKRLVIDADGLFLVGQNPDLVRNYPGVVLTPNAMEYTRLVKAFLNKNVAPEKNISDASIKELAEAVGEQAIVVHKGLVDVIGDGCKGRETMRCSAAGSGRRCGGQGDILAGALSTFNCWADRVDADPSPKMLACYAACRLVRECNAAAFKVNHRGMLASDMLEEVAPTFNKFFEIDS